MTLRNVVLGSDSSEEKVISVISYFINDLFKRQLKIEFTTRVTNNGPTKLTHVSVFI